MVKRSYSGGSGSGIKNLLRQIYKNRYSYLFISPFFILFVAFFLLPALRSFHLSLFKSKGAGVYSFVLFKNYIRLFGDEIFLLSLKNSFIMMLMTTLPQIVLSVLLAVLINSSLISKKGKMFFRTVFFIPITLSSVIIAVVFTLIFDQGYGVLNYIITSFGGEQIGWLTTEALSKVSVASLVVWRWTGWNIVLVLAALQSVPKSLYDAAAIDGAGPVNQFFSVTLPSIRSTIVFLVMLSVIDGMRIFAEPSILTRGGPAKSSYTVMMYLYDQAFYYFNYGYASGIAVVVFLIIVILATASWKIMQRQES